ncbi:MAG: DNA ligase D [Chitinophagaceae bacterium]
MGLTEYKNKRNFKVTPEPGPKVERSKKNRFVIQRHQATRLHYDFRLELDGVLKSWAVPKGPSINPADKRLAMMVEDHPVSYIGFTGVIPEGNYGAGEVEIWDEGTFEPVDAKSNTITEKAAMAALHAGNLKVRLNGTHLKGEFALVRMKDEKAWLLIKHRDEFATDDEYTSENVLPVKMIKEVIRDRKLLAKKTQKTNSKSQGKIEEEKKKNGKTVTAKVKSLIPGIKKSAKKSATKKSAPRKAAVKKNVEPEQPQQKFTRFRPGRKLEEYIEPMLASLGDDAFDNSNWIFELKWDGYRAIAEVNKKNVRLYSRNGLSFNERYPVLADELKQLNLRAVLDGEVVVFNEEGRPDFQKLQHYDDNRHLPLVYYVFDILSLNNKDLKHLPLIERKSILLNTLLQTETIRYSDHVEENGNAFFEQVKKSNLEGIMAKKADSIYVTGVRTKEWLKIKHTHTREAVIAGYTEGRGSRKHFGALILGEFRNKRLHYIGHTGTGFSDQKLGELWNIMQKLKADQSPFTEKIPVNGVVTWVKPELVCEIKFSEITRDGILRHPVFMRLRDDKKPVEVKPEPKAVIPPDTDEEKTKTKSSVKTKDVKTKKAKAKVTAEEDQVPETKSEKNKIVVADKHKVELSNIDKIYWPEEKLTKGDMLDYYEKMAVYVLPYLKDRPLSLNRYPNGITQKGFYHKNAGDIAPSWMKTAPIFSESNSKTIEYLVCNNKASLLFIANLGCIEMNPWNSRVQNIENPDWMVIDIDPSDKNTFDEVIETAQVVHEIFEKLKVPSYCKTSGASGLHVYIPLGAKYTYDQVKDFGNIIAMMVTSELPDTTTLERSLSKRADNKIYVDYLQNRRGQTLASAYSVRPKPGATVSTPLEWKEVKPGLHPSQFHIHNIMERVKKKGDLFSEVLSKGIDLNKTLKLL